MSPEAVTARLRLAAELGRQLPRGPRPAVDMSPAAVTARLRECAEVSALCWELARAGRAHRARRG